MPFAEYFLNTLSLWQWGLLALVPPAIIALYFLKLRRQPLEVPSTYLWSRAIEDLHVNSLWQRLRQSLLLLLQLLLIVLIAFTLLRPGWSGTKLEGKRFIFLIDTSASMAASDSQPTRLDQAKQQAIGLVEQMKPDNAAMVISFSNVAKVEQPFTDNRRLLRTKVELIEQTNRTSDLSEALRAASGLANPGQSGDPNNPLDMQDRRGACRPSCISSATAALPSVPTFKLGNLNPTYVKQAGDEQTNVAIATFSTDVNPEKPGQLAGLRPDRELCDAERAVEASLFLNDTLLDAQKSPFRRAAKTGLARRLGSEFRDARDRKRHPEAGDRFERQSAGSTTRPLPWSTCRGPPRCWSLRRATMPWSWPCRPTRPQKIADVSIAEPKLLEPKPIQTRPPKGLTT